jgi:hypothetical protein
VSAHYENDRDDDMPPRDRLEQHVQTVLTTLVGAAILWGGALLTGLSRDVAALTERVAALTATQSQEAQRRDAALAELARVVAQHDRDIAELRARTKEPGR